MLAEGSNAYEFRSVLVPDLWRFFLNNYAVSHDAGLTVVDLAAMRTRFEATLRAADMDELVGAVVISSCDVPVLVAEVERLVFRYADLVAACRAGLVWANENGEPTGPLSGWQFVTDEIPAAPAGHPLFWRVVGPFPLTGHEAAGSADAAGDANG